MTRLQELIGEAIEEATREVEAAKAAERGGLSLLRLAQVLTVRAQLLAAYEVVDGIEKVWEG